MPDTVFLTGATGFLGSHVLETLLEAAYPVRALVRANSRPLAVTEGLETVVGDLHRPGDLVRAMSGCRFLIHVAGAYSFTPSQREEVWETNVKGSSGLLEAARIAGIERAVVTSSSATVGPARNGRPATEENWAEGESRLSAYHRSKLKQEKAVLAARVPSVLLLPTMPLGANDWKPTPTGKMIVDFMRGRIFATLAGGVNVVPVEDVARAHVVALKRGNPRERYLLGGENLPLAELWISLARITSRSVPRREIPYSAALALGWADELRCRITAMVGKEAVPVVPLEGVFMARHRMFVRSDKARAQLDYLPGSSWNALERSVRWYRDHGYAP